MRTIPYETPTQDLLHERAYTAAYLEANPLTASFAPDFLKLQDDWQAMQVIEVALLVALARAEALVDTADFLLDTLFNAIVNSLLTAVNNDRTAPLYLHFLGQKRPSDVRKIVLGEQLTTMRAWIPTLETSSVPALQAHAAPLGQLVARADAAVEALAQAEQKLREFYNVGAHKAFVDKLNALRRLTHGKLGELVFKHPELNLPRDFAEQFFIRDARQREPTITSEQRTIARLEEQLQRHRDILAALEADKATAAEARRQAKAAAELAELEAQSAALAERMAALRGELGPGKDAPLDKAAAGPAETKGKDGK